MERIITNKSEKEIAILLLGRTDHGKSTFINKILNSEVAEEGDIS